MEKGRYSLPPSLNKVLISLWTMELSIHTHHLWYSSSPEDLLPPINYCTHWMVHLVAQKQRLPYCYYRKQRKERKKVKGKKKRVAKCQNMFGRIPSSFGRIPSHSRSSFPFTFRIGEPILPMGEWHLAKWVWGHVAWFFLAWAWGFVFVRGPNPVAI